MEGGVKVDDGDTAVGGEIDAVARDTGLFFMLSCLVLCDRPIALHFPFFGIITSK